MSYSFAREKRSTELVLTKNDSWKLHAYYNWKYFWKINKQNSHVLNSELIIFCLLKFSFWRFFAQFVLQTDFSQNWLLRHVIIIAIVYRMKAKSIPSGIFYIFTLHVRVYHLNNVRRVYLQNLRKYYLRLTVIKVRIPFWCVLDKGTNCVECT